MKKDFIFNFDLDAWIKNVKIEAEDEEEAKQKLVGMSLEDILEEGIVKNFEIKNVNFEVEEPEIEYYEIVNTDGDVIEVKDTLGEAKEFARDLVRYSLNNDVKDDFWEIRAKYSNYEEEVVVTRKNLFQD